MGVICLDNTQLSLVFGNQALADLSNRKAIEAEIDRLYRENDILEFQKQSNTPLKVNITLKNRN